MLISRCYYGLINVFEVFKKEVVTDEGRVKLEKLYGNFLFLVEIRSRLFGLVVEGIYRF